MEEIVFKAKDRKVTGKQVRALRREGRLPAVLYGHHIGSIPISLDFHEASMVLPKISSSHLVKISVEGGEQHTALVREKQRHPVTGYLIHVDFQAVSLTETLRAMVRLELVGLAPAIRDFDGVLVSQYEEIEVECLPGDLPERISVDITVLKKIGDSIHVRDLQIPESVEVLTASDEMVVIVTPPAVAVQEEVVEVAAEGEPEVIERGKREEENF